MFRLDDIAAQLYSTAIVSGFSLSLLTALELLLPRTRHSLRERVVGLTIWVCYVPFSIVARGEHGVFVLGDG